MNNTKFLGGAAVAILLATPGSAFAENYAAASWLHVNSLLGAGYKAYSEKVAEATNGEITFEIHYSGSLLPPREVLQGVGRGVAQLGVITAAYTPADLPLNNVLGDVGLSMDDPYVAAFTAADVRFNNADLLGEWAGHNVVYAGSYASTTYYLQCTSPVINLEDIKGKKARTVGSSQVEFLKSVGAIPVSVPAPDTYSGLGRGSIDCTFFPDDALAALKMKEVVSDVTRLSMGVFVGGATMGFNKDFWKAQSNENRRILLDLAAATMVQMVDHGIQDGIRGIEESKEFNVKFNVPADDLQAAIDEFKTGYFNNLAATSMEKRSIEDPSELISQVFATRDKWRVLLEGVDRNDHEALIALLRVEVFDKVDEASYGLN